MTSDPGSSHREAPPRARSAAAVYDRSWRPVTRQDVLRGLPRERLFALMDQFRGLIPARFVDRIVPRATLARRKVLPLEGSERTERISRLLSLAEQVWEDDPASAREFLARPHPLLGGESPLEACLTELGGREVERILLSIEHGLPV